MADSLLREITGQAIAMSVAAEMRGDRNAELALTLPRSEFTAFAREFAENINSMRSMQGLPDAYGGAQDGPEHITFIIYRGVRIVPFTQ